MESEYSNKGDGSHIQETEDATVSLQASHRGLRRQRQVHQR